jgi:hypothetical protein
VIKTRLPVQVYLINNNYNKYLTVGGIGGKIPDCKKMGSARKGVDDGR